MIYTVTANPSLDYIVGAQNFTAGATNRTSGEMLRAGGKGINVSLALHRLGIPSRAIGFSAGFTGQEIERQLAAQGIDAAFIRAQGGCSRINVKIRSTDENGTVREETEINGSGPAITEADCAALCSRLSFLGEGDFLVLAGSIPAPLPKTFYRRLMEQLVSRGVQFVVDTTGEQLTETLVCRPFLIKPNNHELGELFGTLRRNAPPCTPVNSVGAGDSMVAGFIAGWLASGDFAQALRYGVCAGTASAASGELVARDVFDRLLAQTEAETI